MVSIEVTTNSNLINHMGGRKVKATKQQNMLKSKQNWAPAVVPKYH